jgi:hypothetical protein
VFLTMELESGSKQLRFGPGYRVSAETDFFTEVRHLLGDAAVVA